MKGVVRIYFDQNIDYFCIANLVYIDKYSFYDEYYQNKFI